jgi:RNA polymerase sigma-70 factor, ECF subfamily
MDVHANIKAWIDGNDRSFRNIFDHYYPRLFSAALKMTGNSTETEELVMNVFMNIWKYRHNVHTVHDFSGYLFGILKNEVIAAARSRVLATEDISNIPVESAGFTLLSELSFKELQARYKAAIDRLPEKRRAVFLLSREQGLSQQQIAIQHNISINTVNNHIKAALKLIREDLRDYQYLLLFVFLLYSLY